MPRTPLLALTLAALATPANEVLLSPLAQEGAVLVRTCEMKLELTVVEMDGGLVRDGEPLEVPYPWVHDFRGIEERRFVWTDEVLAVAGDRAVCFERRFDELFVKRNTAPSVSRWPDEYGECELEQRRVVFERDEDGDWSARALGAGRIDDEALEDLRPGGALDEWLPGRELEPGDSWEVPPAALRHVVAPLGRLRFEDDEEQDLGPLLDPEVLEDLEGTLDLELVGVRRVDGRRIARVEIAGELEGSATLDEPHATVDLEEREHTVDLELDLEGHLDWDVDGGHVDMLALEVETVLRDDVECVGEWRDDPAATFRWELAFEGLLTLTLHSER